MEARIPNWLKVLMAIAPLALLLGCASSDQSRKQTQRQGSVKGEVSTPKVRGPIKAVEDCNAYGQPATTTLFNADKKPVAKWERKFDGSYIESEKLIDLSTGKTVRVWTFDEFSRRVEDKMFVCLDHNGNWVRDKGGSPLLVKMFPARERQTTHIEYSKYNSRIPDTKTTTIEPCENCGGETGNLCSYVY